MYGRKPLGKFGTPKPQSRAARGAALALQQRQRRSRYLQRITKLMKGAEPRVSRHMQYSQVLERLRRRCA